MTVERDPTARGPVAPGSCWRQTMLGTDAVYRVVEVSGEHATVQVCDAPGLEPGTQIRLTVAALAAMTPVYEP